MAKIDSPTQNHVLSSLSKIELARQLDELDPVVLKQGLVLYEPNNSINYIYFPTTCVVSLSFTTQTGGSVELAMTGRDGLVGIPVVLGSNTTTHRIVVQRTGKAYRMKAEVMRWELDQGSALRQHSLRYALALMTQMAQGIVCYRHHSLDQQLCRWLLLSLDLLEGDQLEITHERISGMLGVRREGVTEAAGSLQDAGLIRYSRGHIEVVDRAGLEARVCECYSIVKAEHDRLCHLEPNIRLKERTRPNPSTCRQRAEIRVQQIQPALLDTPLDSVRLLHELQVHQVELEMQNDELRNAYAEADASRERYADIYDFAPVSYFTIDPHGIILDMNLAGAILLGIQRSQRSRVLFKTAVVPESRTKFDLFVKKVLQSKSGSVCEVDLLATAQRAKTSVLIEAVTDEMCQECRMVVIETTAKYVAKKLSQRMSQNRQTPPRFE